MSLAIFQVTMVRLIADPDFRDRVRDHRNDSLPNDLTVVERARLLKIADSRGLDVNRTLHKGFRLGKLRALLPLTCRAIGSHRLGREASAFWQAHPPTSFYFLPEALEFCAFLENRAGFGKYVREVLAYERASLELQRARIDRPPAQIVQFQHDPAALLAALAAGRRPRGILPRRCIALGIVDVDGKIRWEIEDATTPLRSDKAH
jgi:hypothetical protein